MNAKAKVGLLVSMLAVSAAGQSPARADEPPAPDGQANPSSAVDSVLKVLARIAALLYEPQPN